MQPAPKHIWYFCWKDKRIARYKSLNFDHIRGLGGGEAREGRGGGRAYEREKTLGEEEGYLTRWEDKSISSQALKWASI
jgi:hypothetical protein